MLSQLSQYSCVRTVSARRRVSRQASEEIHDTRVTFPAIRARSSAESSTKHRGAPRSRIIRQPSSLARPSPSRARIRTLTATFTPVLSCTPSFTHPNAPLPSVRPSAYGPTRVTFVSRGIDARARVNDDDVSSRAGVARRARSRKRRVASSSNPSSRAMRVARGRRRRGRRETRARAKGDGGVTHT